MKFTAIVHKTYGEFASIESYNDTGKFELCTHDLPDPRPADLTIETLKEYYTQRNIIIEGIDDIEVKRYDFFEEGAIGADIRNKLSPIKTLLDILSVISQYNNVLDHEQKERLLQIIFGLIKKSEENVTYLSKLL